MPTLDVIDPGTGLPAGGYGRMLGIGTIVLGLLLGLGAFGVVRGMAWPLGLLVAWQPFQLVVGFSLLGEPGLTVPIAAVAIALVVSGILAIATLVALLVAQGRRSS